VVGQRLLNRLGAEFVEQAVEPSIFVNTNVTAPDGCTATGA
jgi:hypothetical protein